MTDERCIDCGLHVFECECTSDCANCGQSCENCICDELGIGRDRPFNGETREQRDERRAGV